VVDVDDEAMETNVWCGGVWCGDANKWDGAMQSKELVHKTCIGVTD
jgi:hypothetical protein